MNPGQIDISVVIGFKDWGIERLLLSIASIRESFGEKHGEVVVSDFGSETFEKGELKEIIESAGAVYVRTETDGNWSRSRAVNAGYSVSKGSVVVATDADMLFTPKSMEIIAEEVSTDPNSAIILQCRDLPEGYDHNRIGLGDLSFEQLHRVSQIRPRWGMGGMFAAHRNLISAVGGYDNRMHTYGGEDIDLAVRVRRSGSRVRWLESDQVRMYHIWHEPTMKTVEEDEAAQKAVEANRAIYHKDLTWKRNTELGEFQDLRISWAQESVSVIIPGDDLFGNSNSTFTLVSPVAFQARLDLNGIVSKELDSEYRAFVGQVAAFKTPESRTAPNWEVDFRLPVLAFDSRFAPIVERYFANGRWDILGAARRLQAAGIRIGPSSEVFGLLDGNLEASKLAVSRDWEWNFALGLFPRKPGPRGTSELIQNLPINVLAGIMPAMDVKIFSTSVRDAEQLTSITEMATEWSLSQDLLTNKSHFEAILLNVSEADATVLSQLNTSIDIEISRISFEDALEEIERISKFKSLVEVVEGIRSAREVHTGAVQVSWIENPPAIDEVSLKEARAIGGDFVEVQNDDFHARVWVAPNPLMDMEGNLVSSLTSSDHFADWNTGAFGPIPIEALVALGGRL